MSTKLLEPMISIQMGIHRSRSVVVKPWRMMSPRKMSALSIPRNRLLEYTSSRTSSGTQAARHIQYVIEVPVAQ